MKFGVYSYRDALVGFGSPILENNDQTAKRGFSMQMNNPNGLMNFSAKDYDLYKLGEFDIGKGEFILEKVPVLVCTGVSVIGE